jgi:TolA-binding protein
LQFVAADRQTFFGIAARLRGEGNGGERVPAIEQAAKNTTDPKIVQQSLFEAGIQFDKIGKLEKAALNFESLCKKYSWSEHAKEAIYRAGTLREKLEQFQLAAANYLELLRLSRMPQEAAGALFNAGLAYEKAKDWHGAAKTFTSYLNKFPNENERTLEAIFKVAFAHEQNKSISAANLWYQKLLNKYNQLANSGQYADEYFASRATFRLAEIKNSQFQAIKLKPPLQHNLEKKQLVFNDMMKLYVKVTAFNIAEWTTASFYHIGLAYENFCQDIFNSPAPPNLNEQQQNSYWNTIQQQWITPLQKEALKYYQLNEHLALENSIDNDWVKKSQSRVLFLNRKLANYEAGSGINNVKETVGSVAIKKKTNRRSL